MGQAVIDYHRPLTSEQAIMVEQNHNLIYSYLRKYNLNFEDYYDLVALGLIRAVQAWHQSDYVRTFKFSTIAFRAMFNQVRNYQRGDLMHAPPAFLSIDAGSESGALIADIIPDTRNNIERLLDQLEIETVLSGLTDEQKLIVKMMADGALQREIAEAIGTSQVGVSRRLTALRKQLQKGA